MGGYRLLVFVVVLFVGDFEFGVRNVWVWVVGGVRCKRVAYRITEVGVFFFDWFVWVFVVTKRGDGEIFGCEYLEFVFGSFGGFYSGAVFERVTFLVFEGSEFVE